MAFTKMHISFLDCDGLLLHQGYKLILPDFTILSGGDITNIEDVDDEIINVCIVWNLPNPINITKIWINFILESENIQTLELWGTCINCDKRRHNNCGPCYISLSEESRFDLYNTKMINDVYKIQTNYHVLRSVLKGG